MSGVEQKENIIVTNAKENNLKGISVSIPLNAITCVTGPSGCGKSSLVYDTIYAESQRNFLESMVSNFYGQKLMDKPEVDNIENLRPTLNVSQTYYNVNPRSTIGTVTDISYYIRTVFSLYALEKYNLSVDVNYFSPNNPSSFCNRCNGLGEEYIVAEELIMPDLEKTLDKGGITYFKGNKTSLEYKLLEANCDFFNIDIKSKVKDLSNRELFELLYRDEELEFLLRYKSPKGKARSKKIKSKGAVVELKELLKEIDTPSVFAAISKYLKKCSCSICKGSKLKKEILDIHVEGLNIYQVEILSIENLLVWVIGMEKKIKNMNSGVQIKQLIDDIKKKLEGLIHLNLSYLSLSRTIPSLSGGEIQRIRLSKQLSCSLSGLVYILDEPCKGLHYKNVNSIISVSKQLVKKGNTLITIEHNKQYISNADKIIELGPQGEPEGGYITNEDVKKKVDSNIYFKPVKRAKEYISIKGIKNNNLKNIDVDIPVSQISCITGVSGSGKSSLSRVIDECCSHKTSALFEFENNSDKIKKVLHVNQNPIGKNPRSTVVSYLEIYEGIRNKFAFTDEAIDKGLKPSFFSMNISGGRCESCQGTGKKKIELTYLPDSFIKCPECKGKRFNEDILKIKYRDNNINDILSKPISDIYNIFSDDSNISSYLECIIELGMGYISLGQMSMNLSGGEAQRIKLAKSLGAKSDGKNLYILDEPSSGLNEKDIDVLEKIILRLKEHKETVIIIDHNIEFISHVADYLIDLGVMSGDKGGNEVIQGFPLDVVQNPKSSWHDFGI